MQPAPFRGFLLINPLSFAYTTDGTTEADADIEGHRA
jgi:hypothetical protein